MAAVPKDTEAPTTAGEVTILPTVSTVVLIIIGISDVKLTLILLDDESEEILLDFRSSIESIKSVEFFKEDKLKISSFVEFSSKRDTVFILDTVLLGSIPEHSTASGKKDITNKRTKMNCVHLFLDRLLNRFIIKTNLSNKLKDYYQ